MIAFFFFKPKATRTCRFARAGIALGDKHPPSRLPTLKKTLNPEKVLPGPYFCHFYKDRL